MLPAPGLAAPRLVRETLSSSPGNPVLRRRWLVSGEFCPLLPPFSSRPCDALRHVPPAPCGVGRGQSALCGFAGPPSCKNGELILASSLPTHDRAAAGHFAAHHRSVPSAALL